MATSSRAERRQTLNIRIKVDERGLIDRAAHVRGQNRTDFILEAARRAAEEALVDRSMIAVGEDGSFHIRETLATAHTPPCSWGATISCMRWALTRSRQTPAECSQPACTRTDTPESCALCGGPGRRRRKDSRWPMRRGRSAEPPTTTPQS